MATPPPDFSNTLSLHPSPLRVHLSQHSQSSVSSPPKPSLTTALEEVSGFAFTRSRSTDVEGRPPPNFNVDTDPFSLSNGLKTASELSIIRANTSRRRAGCGPITYNSAARKARKLTAFYQGQNESINRLLKPVDEHIRLAREFDGENHLKVKIAVTGSFVANVLLAALQVYGAASSGSLSLFTTMADALFDPMSNVMLIVANRAVRKVDARRFPSGKARIETAGNIVFCFLMTAVSFILIVLSIMELIRGNAERTNRFNLPSVVAVAIAFATKLFLFCYCWALRNNYSQIRILWEDHRNDLFINGFGILTSVGGSKLAWWIDPMGAIALSLLIATLWLRTAYKEFQLLIGVTAETSMLQWITYICKCGITSCSR